MNYMSESKALLLSDRITRRDIVPLDLQHMADYRSEALRQAQFRYSETVRAGDKSDFNYKPIHQ